MENNLTISDIKLGIIYFYNKDEDTHYAVLPRNRCSAIPCDFNLNEIAFYDRESLLLSSNVKIDINMLLNMKPDKEALNQLDIYISGYDSILPSLKALETRIENLLEWKSIRDKRKFDNSTLNDVIRILNLFYANKPSDWSRVLINENIDKIISDVERWNTNRKSKRLSTKALFSSIKLINKYKDFVNI